MRPYRAPTPEAMLTKSVRQLLKAAGIFHYKNFGGVEICQHALRNRFEDVPVSSEDMNKIIDYAQKLDAAYGDGER